MGRRGKRLEVGAVNLVAADQKNIRYRRVYAQVPDRGIPIRGIQPWKLDERNRSAHAVVGKVLSEDKLPSAKDPDRGYLATANNEPFILHPTGAWTTIRTTTATFYDPGDRAARIESELKRLVTAARSRRQTWRSFSGMRDRRWPMI